MELILSLIRKQAHDSRMLSQLVGDRFLAKQGYGQVNMAQTRIEYICGLVKTVYKFGTASFPPAHSGTSSDSAIGVIGFEDLRFLPELRLRGFFAFSGAKSGCSGMAAAGSGTSRGGGGAS